MRLGGRPARVREGDSDQSAVHTHVHCQRAHPTKVVPSHRHLSLLPSFAGQAGAERGLLRLSPPAASFQQQFARALRDRRDAAVRLEPELSGPGQI